MYKAKISEEEVALKELKLQQRSVKESTEQNTKQMALFNGLRRLLEIKLKSVAKEGKAGGPEPGSEEYNRLVLS